MSGVKIMLRSHAKIRLRSLIPTLIGKENVPVATYDIGVISCGNTEYVKYYLYPLTPISNDNLVREYEILLRSSRENIISVIKNWFYYFESSNGRVLFDGCVEVINWRE